LEQEDLDKTLVEVVCQEKKAEGTGLERGGLLETQNETKKMAEDQKKAQLVAKGAFTRARKLL
jgi:hypothetical protein